MVEAVNVSETPSIKASDFKDKVSRFAYTKDSPNLGFSEMAPRTRGFTATMVSDALETKVSKPTSSRGSSQAPSENAGEQINAASPASEDGSIKSTKRKRAPTTSDTNKALPVLKKPRTRKTSSAPALVNKLKDSVRPGLILISVGVNPGKKTGEVGLPYSHKSNKYWPGLFQAGITPVQHKPEHAESLMDLYGLGHTNIVPDVATENESGLTTQQFLDGAATLDKKIRDLKPEAVMLLGRGIWYRWMQYKTGKRYDPKKEGPLDLGLQSKQYWIGRKAVLGKVEYEGARTYVLESPSGQAAISREQRVKNWKIVGDWFTPKREQWMKERADKTEEGVLSP